MDSIVDSLAGAIIKSDIKTERNLSVFCLSLINYNENTLNKFTENADSIRDRLNEDPELA
jgi:hypothetical protein